VYGTGFPKSLDVSKAIDKQNGHWRGRRGKKVPSKVFGTHYEQTPKGHAICAAAAAWSGFGTALKPAYEPIILARKPLDGTVAANVQQWGCGALNIDGCRIETGETPAKDRRATAAKSGKIPTYNGQPDTRRAMQTDGRICSQSTPEMYLRERAGENLGRFPANLIHDGSDEVLAGFPVDQSTQQPPRGVRKVATGSDRNGNTGAAYGAENRPAGSIVGFDYGDNGSAARFFYCAKASRAERNGSKHPTVKPLALIRYLCRLVTPPGGTILDPFLGSGTTAEAAMAEGFRCLGIEQNDLDAAKRRIRRQLSRHPLLAEAGA